jgi:DNA polymerase sigma
VVTKPFTESNKVRTLSDMARAMRQSKIADTVAIISKARVPIIKFVTNEGKLAAAFPIWGMIADCQANSTWISR